MSSAAGIEPARPIATHEVRGGDGVRLHVSEWGDPDGAPVVFVHGWSQCELCWGRQVSGPLAGELRLLTFDLRGHGSSERPPAPEAYADAALWADDLAAVVALCAPRRPVLVAWSYGGFMVTDYLRAYGEDAIAGVNLVGGAVRLAPGFPDIGPAFLDNAPVACGEDLNEGIAAVRRFVAACTARPLGDDEREAALCWTMAVAPAVRGALLARERLEADDVLAGLSVPVLVSHGTADAIVLPSMAEHVLAARPAAQASWYEGTGHMPFLEAPERFDRELRELVARGGG